MATTPPRLTNPFLSSRSLPATVILHHNHSRRPFTLAAADVDSTESDPETTRPESDQFESRLAKIRVRNRSGTGKKAEVRKSKRGSMGGSAGMNLPAVKLRESMSGGLKVELGFSPYSERVNGRIAGLGLAALLMVELATGKSVLNYHTPAIVLIQVYFVAAVSALFVKYEKEKVSVWPKE